MKKNITQKSIIVTLITLLIAALCLLSMLLSIIFDSAAFGGVGIDEPSASVENYIRSGVYKIDANTILEAIDHDQVFFPPDANAFSDSITKGKLEWGQAEYLRVANAFFEFVWREPLDKNWSIERMVFNTSCKENPADFESATFIFYQQIFQQRELRYKARVIEILPLDGKILWGGGNTFHRPVFGTKVFDLDELKISADEVLNIAEENEGKAMRQSFQNDCELYLVLGGKDWLVVYNPEVSDSQKLEINIDPYTGKVINSIMR